MPSMLLVLCMVSLTRYYALMMDYSGPHSLHLALLNGELGCSVILQKFKPWNV